MEVALPVVSEPLTANALAPDHETGLSARAIAARRRHSGSIRPAPITAAVNWSLKIGYGTVCARLCGRPNPVYKISVSV